MDPSILWSSNRNGDLTLNDTQTKCMYRIENHYQVKIDGQTYRGRPLCVFIKSVYEVRVH